MPTFSQQDCVHMAQAIQLAKQGRFTTAPNPNVGCVLVKDGFVIGQGYHQRAGEGHAEVLAILDAEQHGNTVAGACAYVTLEPCSHQGRTPACAQLLIDKCVAKVVIAMGDPNPKVAGRGIRLLQQAGIDVQLGLMETSARALNYAFLSRVERERPYLRLKLAASIDARTALANGESKWITSAFSREDVQRERALSHGILSTAATVLRDNASLNVRHQQLGYLAEDYPAESVRQPLRVVIDRQQRLSQASASLNIFQQPENLIVVSYTPQVLPEGVQQLIVAEQETWLNTVFHYLSQKFEINDLWVEAGSNFAAALLNQGLVDQLICYQAGLLMGQDAHPLIALSGLDAMSDLNRWQCLENRRIGPDIKSIWQSQF